MASFFSQEHRPLKRKREEKGNLGAPDVFPQDKNQKEDDLSSDNVKKGFQSLPIFSDDTEYGFLSKTMAQTHSVSASLENLHKRLRDSFVTILTKKAESNVISDKGDRKKVSKDNFWQFLGKNEAKKDLWFKDLAGTKPLERLSQSVPIFNILREKDDVFVNLCKFNVPMLRAAWYIKMNHQYLVTYLANPSRKNKEKDPSQDWTASIIKFLRDQLIKLTQFYNENPMAASATLPHQDTIPTKDIETEYAFKHWNYCIRLARFMLDEALLDKSEFLDKFLLEKLESLRPSDDGLLRFLIPLLLEYVDDYVHSELLSRRLAYFCARRLQLFCDHVCASPRVQSPMLPSSSCASQTRPATPMLNPVASLFAEYSECALHRAIVLGLSCCIQNIALRCPSALVWNYLGEGKSQNSVFSGSPLDLLPCAPSSLPMPNSNEAPHVRSQLLVAEQEIVLRGRAAEGRWSTDKCQQSRVGSTVSRVLAALDALDRHHFDKWDDCYNLDILYRKIFEPDSFNPSSELEEPNPDDEPIVNLLCEWAVSVYRIGEHRALAVAKILEKRQNRILYPSGGAPGSGGDDTYGSAMGNDEGAVPGGGGVNDAMGGQDSGSLVQVNHPLLNGTPVFQHLLFNFLDTQAPTLDESSSRENRTAFANLVSLFTELVRHDVFSHDAYICTLIARGDLVSGGINGAVPLYQSATKMNLDGGGLSCGDNPSSVRSALDISGGPRSLQGAGLGTSMPGDSDMDFMSPAGGAFLGGATPDRMGPSSVKSDRGCLFNDPMSAPPHSVTSVNAGHGSSVASVGRPPRHLMYALHFPIPQDESTLHETNQRLLVLYGVGSGRDQANKTVKKANKELLKLFGKKNCHDIAGDGGKTKKKKDRAAGLPPVLTAEAPIPGAPAPPPGSTPADLAGVNAGTGSSVGAPLLTQSVNLSLISSPTTAQYSPQQIEEYQKIYHRFSSLSYYDMHVVTSQCVDFILEQSLQASNGASNYLPTLENISFLFDLMEFSLNISGLVYFAISLLRLLSDVESQLANRNSALMGQYAQGLGLCIVALLRRYLPCLLVSPENTSQAFEGLISVVKHVNNPSDCSSADRCILAFLCDLYESCSHLKTTFADIFSTAYNKVKESLSVNIQPSQSNYKLTSIFLQDLINNPRAKIDPGVAKELSESPLSRYSFVCNVILTICNMSFPAEKLHDLAVLCAELTACCNSLASEWLGVLKALCCSSNHPNGYIDILTQVDVGDVSIHDSLATFTSVLVARHCFSLEHLVAVIIPSLLSALTALQPTPNCPVSSAVSEAEPGARLTCHLLLRIFSGIPHPSLGPPTPLTPHYLNPHSSSTPSASRPSSSHSSLGGPGLTASLRTSWDRHLLAATHTTVSVGAVLAVLKAIQMLGECDDQDYNALSPSDSHAEGVTQEAIVNPTASNAASNATPISGAGAAATTPTVAGSMLSSSSATAPPATAPSATTTPGDAASNESRMKDHDISISSLLGNIDDLDDYPFPGGSGNASTPGGGSAGGGGGSTPGGGRTPGGSGANTPAKTSGNSGGGAPDAFAIGAAASFNGAGGAATPAAPLPPPPPPQKSDIGSLTEFAKLVLRTMCGQEWVRERCLQDPESLFQQQHLLDPCLSQSQTRHLLHLICYPGGVPEQPEDDDGELDLKAMIDRILVNLDQWSMRVSLVEIQLLIKQATITDGRPVARLSDLLDTLSERTISLFQQQTEGPPPSCTPGHPGLDSRSGVGGAGGVMGAGTGNPNSSFASNASVGVGSVGPASALSMHTTPQPASVVNAPYVRFVSEKSHVWLVAPLIAKLSSQVQGKVLKAAGLVLEKGNIIWTSKSKMEKERLAYKSTSLLSHQPFLQLILTCLKGQDEQREGLLQSLHTQFAQFLQLKEEQLPEDRRVKQIMHEALQLRFSLVGGMFDTIQRSQNSIQEWSHTFTQLICNSVIDLYSTRELFTTVYDMLMTLIHGTLASDPGDHNKSEEINRKAYNGLVKKLKKETGDKQTEAVRQLKQLFPIPKQSVDIITCEPIPTSSHSRDKESGGSVVQKPAGLRIKEKTRLNAWELLEGQRNPAPLSLSLFGAVRVERKTLRYETQHHLLMHHRHEHMVKKSEYFLEPPVLPPEDLVDDPPSASPKAAVEAVANAAAKKVAPNPQNPTTGIAPPLAAASVAPGLVTSHPSSYSMSDLPMSGANVPGGPGPPLPTVSNPITQTHPNHPAMMPGNMGVGAGGPPGHVNVTPHHPPPPMSMKSDMMDPSSHMSPAPMPHMQMHQQGPPYGHQGLPPGMAPGMPPSGMIPQAPMKGAGPMTAAKTTTAKGRGKKKGSRNGSTSGPTPAAIGTSPGVAGYPGATPMGSTPGTPVRYPSPFQPSDPVMFTGPPQGVPAGPTGPAGSAGIPPTGTYPQVSQPPTSWYQGQQQPQPMTAGVPQQTPLYSNTPYPRMPYMAQGSAPNSASKAAVRAMLNNRHQSPTAYPPGVPAPPNATMTIQGMRIRQMQMQRMQGVAGGHPGPTGNMPGGTPEAGMYANQFTPQQQMMMQQQQQQQQQHHQMGMGGTYPGTSGNNAMQGVGSGYPMQPGMMGPTPSTISTSGTSMASNIYTQGTMGQQPQHQQQQSQGMMGNQMGGAQPAGQFIGPGGQQMPQQHQVGVPGGNGMVVPPSNGMVVPPSNGMVVPPSNDLNQPMSVQQQRMMQMSRQNNVAQTQQQPQQSQAGYQANTNQMQYMMQQQQQQGGNPQMMSQLQRQLTQGGSAGQPATAQPGNTGAPYQGQPGGQQHY